MKNSKYNKIADKHKAKEDRVGNLKTAFICGGIMGMIAEGMIELLCFFGISRVDGATLMIVFFIGIASLFTGLGFFDKLVEKYKCGLIIPITGFAHAMTSSCLDYKREGPIYGVGSNMFKLAGSVIIYGVVSAFVFGSIRYFLGGI